MGEIDIAALFRVLVEYQKLDPKIARKLLHRILEILQEIQADQ